MKKALKRMKSLRPSSLLICAWDSCCFGSFCRSSRVGRPEAMWQGASKPESIIKEGKTTLLRFRNQPSQELPHFPSPDVFALRSVSSNSSPCKRVHVSKSWPLTWPEIRMRKPPLFAHSLHCRRKQGNNSFKSEVFFFCILFSKCSMSWNLLRWRCEWLWSSRISDTGRISGSIFGGKTTAVLEAVSHWDVTRPGLKTSPRFSHGGYLSSETAHNRPA